MNFTRIGLVPWDSLGLLRVARSSLTQLLLEIKNLVVASGAYSLSQVAVTLDPKPLPLQGGPIVTIRPGQHRLITDQWAGAGFALAGYTGQIPITLIDQCLLDSVGRDDAALLRFDRGLFDRAMALAEYLTGEAAARQITATGLVQTPLGVTDVSEPSYRDREDRRWRCVVLTVRLDWAHVYQQGFI